MRCRIIPTSSAPPTLPARRAQAKAPVPAVVAVGGGGGGCNTARIVQQALRKDPLVRTAVEDAHRTGKAVMLWNGDWVRSGGQDGKGLSAVREAIMWEVAFSPEACRNQRQHGLVLLSLADGSTRFAIGSGDWRWSDLLGVHRRRPLSRTRTGRTGPARSGPHFTVSRHHHQNDAAVLRPVGAGLVVGDRVGLAVGDGRHAVQRHAMLVHEQAHGFGPLFTQPLIGRIRSGGIGVALDFQIDIAVVVLQLVGKVASGAARLPWKAWSCRGELHRIVRQDHGVKELAFGQLAGGGGAVQRILGGLVELGQMGLMLVQC